MYHRFKSELKKKDDRVAIVYALINPFNNRVFYIGSTRRGLQKRLREHISERYLCRGCSDKNAIIRYIIDKGKIPIIKSLCKCPTSDQFRMEMKYHRGDRKIKTD